MTSFISAASLLVLVLATGCFTSPIPETQFSSSTFSSLNNDFTTSDTKKHGWNSFDTQMTSDGATTEFPRIYTERTIDEELDVQTSTSINRIEFEENTSLSPLMFNELSTSEPLEFTTQGSLYSLEHKEREANDLSVTTVEPEDASEPDNGSDMDKREFQVELTTNYMPSFTSSSSDVAPGLYTWESSTLSSSDVFPRFYTSESSTTTSTSTPASTSTSTSTEKYVGLLKVDAPREEEDQPKKWAKSEENLIPKSKEIKTEKFEDKVDEDVKTTTTRKPKVQFEDKSEEDVKTTTMRKPKVQFEDKVDEDVKTTTTRKPKVQFEDKSEEDTKETTPKKAKIQFEDKSGEDIKMTTTPKKTKVESEDKSEEDTKTKKPTFQPEEGPKDPNMRVAHLFQDAPYNGPNYPSNVMILEDSKDVVTALPDISIKTTSKDDQEHEHDGEHEHDDEHDHDDEHKPKTPLNQVEKPTLFKKKE